MSAFLPLILFIVIGIAVRAGQSKAKQSSSQKPASTHKTVATKPVSVRNKPAVKAASHVNYFGAKDSVKVPKISSKKVVEIGTLKDDPKNDWLAQQLREEQAVLRRREYLDLGAAHKKACAADAIKIYHEEHCDADSIDTGLA